MFDLIPIPKDHVESMFPRMEHYLSMALSSGNSEMSAQDALDDAVFGRISLYIIISKSSGEIVGSGATRIIDYHRKSVIQVFALGGDDFDLWGDSSINSIERIAAELGLDGIEIYGRKGWEKIFKKHGYSHTYSVMTRIFDEQ